jgi:hypothetical protein
MIAIAVLFCITIVVLATWLLPRRLGWLGLFCAHGFTAAVIVVYGAIEVATGHVYYETKVVVGWIFGAVVANALLLPLGILAVAYAHAPRPGPRGFPVIPTVSTRDQSHPDEVRDTLSADDRA